MTTIRCGVVHNLELPKALHDYLGEIGGLNVYGDPLFRIAWSNNLTKETRLPWPPAVSRITERPHRLKYGKALVTDRFIVEKWEPASSYGNPADWVDTGWKAGFGYVDYGPYPSRGKYNLVDTVEGVDSLGAPCFLMPTRQYLRTVVDTVHYIKGISVLEQQYMAEAREEIEEKAQFERRLAMIKDANKPSNYHDAWVSLNTPGKVS